MTSHLYLAAFLLIFGRLVNAFGFWQGQPITNASHTYFDDLSQAFGHIQSLAGSISTIELWNGETGWPGDGLFHPQCPEHIRKLKRA